MVTRAANGLENSRSTLTTGMPASMALIAAPVSAAPSVGSSTIASTPSLMKVSIWVICRLASFVPSATRRSMSGYLPASARAAELMAPSQPWSAAGPGKPMPTRSPAASLSVLLVGCVDVPASPAVQPVMRPVSASAAPAAMATCRPLPEARIAFLRSSLSAVRQRVGGPSRGVRVGPVLVDAAHASRSVVPPSIFFLSLDISPSAMVPPMVKGDSMTSLLSMRGITKSFAGVRALKGVDLDVRVGEVHCVLGQNGAGKSTLIKVLSGAYQPDGGELIWNGETVTIPHPVAALDMGIATMYQELDVVDGLTISENIYLGHELASGGVLHRASANRRTREL